MFFSPYFKTVHVHIAGRSNCLSTIDGGIFSDEASNSLSTMRRPSPGQRCISITKDKITDSEAMHFFTTESGRNAVAYGWMTTLSTSPDDVLSADIGVLLLDVGCL